MDYKILDNKEVKVIKSKSFNHFFDKKTGFAATWGEKKEDDPDFCPIGPLILDIEVTTKCNGVPQKDGVKRPCAFCYKSNTPVGINMYFETFKMIIDKFPKTLGQVAIGADSESTSNPDLWKMMEYCRSKNIIPNITTANITDETADNLAKYCGAVAVSRYEDKNLCYDSVKKLTDRGMTQVNIHQLVAKETLAMCLETIEDIKTDPRLAKLNAIVFLGLKNKGKRNTLTCTDDSDYKKIVDKCLESKINFGFDSCSANKFLRITGDKFKQVAEPCESTCFSSYSNAEGKFFPCSFMEETGDWVEGLDLVECKDFMNDIWNNPKTIKFRDNLIKCGRNCPLYRI